MVGEVVFLEGCETFLATDVVAWHFDESVGLAEVRDVLAGCDMISVLPGFVYRGGCGGVQPLGDATHGGLLGDVIGEEITDGVQGVGVFDFVFFYDVAEDEGVVNFADILVALVAGGVGVGAGEATVVEIAVEGLLDVGGVVVVGEVFFEREREDVDGVGAAGEKCSKVTTHQESVGAGEVDVVLSRGMEAIDGTLEAVGHLDLVDEDEIVGAFFVVRSDVAFEGVVFKELLKIGGAEIDRDDISIGDVGADVLFELAE